MKLLQADHDRRLEIPGVPGLACRPVDIDAAKTGFEDLRSLRIYRFEPEGVIEGHAEEDEVYVVLLAGSAKLVITWGAAEEFSEQHTLTAPESRAGRAVRRVSDAALCV